MRTWKHSLAALVCMWVLVGSTTAWGEYDDDGYRPRGRNIHHYLEIGGAPVGGFAYSTLEGPGYNETGRLHSLFINYEVSPSRFFGLNLHSDFKGHHREATDRSTDELTRTWGLFGPQYGIGGVFHILKNRVVDPYLHIGLVGGTYYHDYYRNIGSSGYGVDGGIGARFFIGRVFYFGADITSTYMTYNGTSYDYYDHGYRVRGQYYDFAVSDVAWKLFLGIAF